MTGLIKSLAEVHLKLDGLQITQRKFMDKGADEDVFLVRWSNQAKKEDDSSSSTSPVPLFHGLDMNALNKAFPFHIMFNKKLEIIQAGQVGHSTEQANQTKAKDCRQP